MDAVSETCDGDVQMIDSSVVRVYQHAANVKKRPSVIDEVPLLPRHNSLWVEIAVLRSDRVRRLGAAV